MKYSPNSECSAQPEFELQPRIQMEVEDEPLRPRFDPTAGEVGDPQPEERSLQIPGTEQEILH